jgi:glucose/arabinose dehydrogenase
VQKTLLGVACGLLLSMAASAWSSTYPSGFRETLVSSALTQPTHFAIAPDGRIFVAEKQGRVRLVKNGTLLTAPVLTVTVHTERYRGIMGIALDRAFGSNGYLYIYYTTTTPTIHNRISRFTIVGDVATAGSERVLFDLPTSASAAHNGGALAVGTDGLIYAGSGDDNTGSNAQTLATVRGKILRIGTDGTIPPDNPFLSSTTGINQAIWAMGVRQPWSIGFDHDLGSMMLQDVGSTTYEEVNVGRAGANYGHPVTEGPTTDPRFDAPLHSYRIGTSGTTGGCAAIGGAFYRPVTAAFPAAYLGRYFFADHCNGWMKTIDPANGNQVAVFATGMISGDGSGVSDIQVAPDGSLYYVLHNGRLFRVTYDSSVPTPTPTPTPVGPTPTPTPSPTPTASPTPGACRVLTGNQPWMNAGFATQSSTFTYELDARPSSASMTALAGLSRGSTSSGQGLMAAVRFGSDGFITMRDGSQWRSATPLRYFANMQYHFRMVVNVPADTYSVWVKPLGEGELLLGSGYRLRFNVRSLDNFAAGVTSSNGSLEVCSRVLKAGTPLAFETP